MTVTASTLRASRPGREVLARAWRRAAGIALVICAGSAGHLAAAEPTGPAAEFASVQHLHAEELAAWAISLDARENSLANDVRGQAMALAKKFDPALHVHEPARKAMSTEEALADKADRESANAHAKQREEAEGYSATAAATTGKDAKEKDAKDKDAKDANDAPADDAGGDPYPPPEDLPARFAAMRYEIIEREIGVALDLDPDDHTAAAVRAAALKELLGIVGTPHWACERRQKSEISTALAAKDEPWTGTFACDRLNYLTLTEANGRITGTWAAKADAPVAGNLVMQVKGRTATGAWKDSSGEQGTVTLTLHCDGKTITGSTTGGGETHQVHGTKRAP
jgi:hypothetical protein